MLKFPNLTVVSLLAFGFISGPALAEKLGLGRPALPDEIAAWDLDVRPDGTGLPIGSGDVLTGEEVFAEKCASCHGDFAEGVDNWPKLAGGMGTLNHQDPLKTVGSFWPYLSTTWDYVNRSMPFGNAQSLTDDEVYAVVAYILYSNDLVDEDFELSNDTFLDVELPNVGGFILDDRLDTEFPQFSAEPCMQDCKDSVDVTMRALVLDVTPEVSDTAEAAMQDAAEIEPSADPVTEPPVALDFEQVTAGEKVFRKCKACHQVGEGAISKTGPILNNVVNAPAGHSESFKYSNAMTKAGADGLVWDEQSLAAFLAKPRSYLKGTKMTFAGLKKEDDIAAVIAYLQSFSN
jgi:cytochrome c2